MCSEPKRTPDLADTSSSGPAPCFEQAATFAEAIDEALQRCRQEFAVVRPATISPWSKKNIFGGTEPVAAVDVAIQRILVRACGRALPTVPVVAEEGRQHLDAVPA